MKYICFMMHSVVQKKVKSSTRPSQLKEVICLAIVEHLVGDFYHTLLNICLIYLCCQKRTITHYIHMYTYCFVCVCNQATLWPRHDAHSTCAGCLSDS
jgi:hypothetical protein